jgi:sigma-B regulation protein RsbU (phosphoserine phosphatase)
LRVAPKPVDLHQIVAECVEELRMVWPGRAIEHRRFGDAQLRADPDRLAQVVTNLTSNALNYGDPGHPITICSEHDEAEARLTVHNLGPAIQPELLEHIFEPLRRGEHEMKLGSRSVGLGLYIVQEIAKSHGGRVTVRSSAERGTTFTLSLPQSAAAPQQ